MDSSGFLVMFRGMNTLHMLAELLLAAVALGLAIHCTVRKRWVLAAWVFGGSYAVTAGLGVVRFVFDLLSSSLGMDMVMLSHRVLALLELPFLFLVAVGLLLFKPPVRADQAAQEVDHG